MSPNRRILLNIVATYGRSLYGLVIGLFCGRWTLMALGHVDFGLMGVVGGLTAFIAFFNGILAGSVGRFYALAVGAESGGNAGVDQSRKWFTLAVVIHTILPIVLMVIGFPFGEWAVRNFLTIPPDRVSAAVWVWRFVCISCFLGMVTVPYNAMYVAHQYIAELTIYAFATTTLNALFLYYMVSHPGDWLARYAFWQCLLNILPNLIISVRACFIFPECRFRFKHIRQWRDIFKIGGYAFWIGIGSLGAMFRSQGIAILVNKCFGPKVNAGVAVGTQLSGQCNTLSASMVGAFSPAICNAWGAGHFDQARKLSYQCCKMGTLLVLIFAIPLSLEVDEVLLLWLKNPPSYASGFCLFVLAMTIIDKLSVGHMLCVSANGRVAKYQSFLGTSLIMTLPIAWCLIKMGLGVYSVGWAIILTMSFCSLGRVWFARSLVGMDAHYWLRRILLPILCLVIFSLLVGVLPRVFLPASFGRVCLTTALVLIVLFPMSWCVVLDREEKDFVSERIKRRFLKR